MPINGMTTGDPQRLGLPQLGTIYKGDPKQQVTSKRTGKPIEIAGKDRDTFRVEFALSKQKNITAEEQALLDQYRYEFNLMYGENPRQFEDVKLCGTTPTAAMTSWYQEWDAAGMTRQCDGVTQNRHWDDRTKRVERTLIPCILKDPDHPCECKPVARIPIILLSFSLRFSRIGYFMLVTHSVNDIIELHSALTRYYTWTQNLSQITFVLSRSPRELSFVDAEGKRKKVTKSLLNLYPDSSFVQQMLLPQSAVPQLPKHEQQQIAAPPAQVALPEPRKNRKIDERPPVTDNLDLSISKVRNAFINMAKEQHGLDMADLLEGIKRLGGSDFKSGVSWYTLCEELEIEMEPPAELQGGNNA